MDAFNAHDFVALEQLSFIHPEAEGHSALAAAEGETYVGAKGWRDWRDDLDAVWDNLRIEVLEVHEVGADRALILFHVTGRGKASDIPLDARTAQVWTWRDGKLWRTDSYTDPREARRAVGMPD